MKGSKEDPSAFLKGKYVYLRPPDIEKDIIKGRWAHWFNDKYVTKYLRHGVYPNTVEKQVEFVQNAMSDRSKVLLCIIDKTEGSHIGVISFTDIDLINRKAEIGIVIGEKKYHPAAPLEAMALMTGYGFERLNLNRIHAGQCTDLWSWVNSLETIGYRIEGYSKGCIIRKNTVYDQFHIGIAASDYYRLIKQRDNKLASSDPAKLLETVKRENKTEKIKAFFESLYD